MYAQGHKSNTTLSNTSVLALCIGEKEVPKEETAVGVTD